MSLNNPLGFLENTALGAEVLKTLGSREALEVGLVAAFGSKVFAELTGNPNAGLDNIPDPIKAVILRLIEQLEQDIGAPIFQSFIKAGLDINLSDRTGQEAPAVRMVERAIGFAAGLPAITAPLLGILETHMGNHAPKELFKALKGIPHEMGMSFFLGTTLAAIFETATLGPIGEAIKEQTRPTRLEWPQVSRLLKAKQIDEATAFDYLKKAGFRDQDIPILQKLDNQLLSMSQVQTLHEIGWFDDTATLDYLDKLGLSSADKDSAMQLFAHQAATEGSSSFRTIARNAFLEQFISETTYKGLLQQVQTPPESVDLLVAGVQLERDAGRLHLTVADIKDLYLNQHIGADEATQRLAILGMQDADIADLLIVWGDSKKTARSGISSAKIIGYLLGGVLNAKQAYDRLVAGGMKPADAQFLVDNPKTHPQTAAKPVSPSTVIAAYKDQVLTIDDAKALLEKMNVDPLQIELLLANANYTVTKGTKPKKPTKTLSEGNVLEALRYGLAEPAWAERELETLGYAVADATLLVMIELTKLDPNALTTYGWVPLT